MSKHIHHDLMLAWKAGATIQWQRRNGDWEDCGGACPWWREDREYRVKPVEVLTIKFRVALMSDHIRRSWAVIDTQDHEIQYANFPDFVRWIPLNGGRPGDWTEIVL